jgi:hypothetical protein
VDVGHFFTCAACQALYRAYAAAILTRRNTLTGVEYR